MKANHELWSPFQSPEVREIVENMNASERRRASLRGAFYGVWSAITFACPIGYLIVTQSNVVRAIAVALVIVHACVIPIWRRYMRRFLCSTAWSRERGLNPETLRLTAWKKPQGSPTQVV